MSSILQMSPTIFDEQVSADGLNHQNKWLRNVDSNGKTSASKNNRRGSTRFPSLYIGGPDLSGDVKIKNHHTKHKMAILVHTPEIRASFKGNKWSAWAAEWLITNDLGTNWRFESNYDKAQQAFYLNPMQTVTITFALKKQVPLGAWGVLIYGHYPGGQPEQLAWMLTVGKAKHPARRAQHYIQGEIAQKNMDRYAIHGDEAMLRVLEDTVPLPPPFVENLKNVIRILQEMNEETDLSDDRSSDSSSNSLSISSSKTSKASRSSRSKKDKSHGVHPNGARLPKRRKISSSQKNRRPASVERDLDTVGPLSPNHRVIESTAAANHHVVI